jgi:threonine dehydrogenase-like Zn-dependent dehydrogenase
VHEIRHRETPEDHEDLSRRPVPVSTHEDPVGGIPVDSDAALAPEDLELEGLAFFTVAARCPGTADVVIETAGSAGALVDGLHLLRPGGRLVTAGLVVPGSIVTFDAIEIVRRCATIRVVHNDAPRHLVVALPFVQAHRDRLPFGDLVDARFPLEVADAAPAAAVERRALRPAVVP